MYRDPWHLRVPSLEHYQWFRNLVDIHELTTQWLRECQTSRPTHQLSRGFSSEVAQNLWMLNSLSEKELEDFLSSSDDTQPTVVLTRLERTVLGVQSWTVHRILSQLESGESGAMERHALEIKMGQIAWKLGRSAAEARWPSWVKRGDMDLREILSAARNNPFSGYPHREGFLIRRSTSEDVEVELRSCVHQLEPMEMKLETNTLCSLHFQWFRGFVEALNSSTCLEHTLANPFQRCLQRWRYTPN